MPTWKIEEYWFYFKVSDLTKNKPAHIHVETPRGEIEFWLEPPNTKIKVEITVKKIKGVVSKEEQNETERLVKKNRGKFLKEWNRRKEKLID